jgi:hypothetical protein
MRGARSQPLAGANLKLMRRKFQRAGLSAAGREHHLRGNRRRQLVEHAHVLVNGLEGVHH